MPKLELIQKFPHYLKLMRFDKPIGSLLLLWPTLWALWIASHGNVDPGLAWVFVLGVLVMRSAGCVINDYADREFDPKVERTQLRPLAAGDLQPSQALTAFVLLGLIALILLYFLPSRVWPWSVPAMLVTIAYPFMKRFIQAPQAVLGIAFSFSIPMIYTAVDHRFDTVFYLLLTMNFCWVIAYDTAYAMSDREDDLEIGVKSTAILFGWADKLFIAGLQAFIVMCLFALKQSLALSAVFYVAILVVAALFLYQQWLIKDRARLPCFQAFLNNAWVGGVIWFGLLLG